VANFSSRSILVSHVRPLIANPIAQTTMMSEDMRYWKAATSKISSFKGYLAQKDPRSSPRFRVGESVTEGHASSRQTWSQWAGSKLKLNIQGQDSNNFAVERLSLFPGWAARRLHNPVADVEGLFETQ
jgi:hypothetical protein